MNGLRPLIGNSVTRRFSTHSAGGGGRFQQRRRGADGYLVGDIADLQLKIKVVLPPTWSTMLSRTARLKPAALAETPYVPGCRKGIV